ALLVNAAGRVVSDEEILNTVWGGDEYKHALDTTIARLRHKIKQCRELVPGRIVRHRNKGFSFS
ncbi:MAG: winged helix-turn-helix domain-containing protein, partial [Chloroflexota bacterium]|nr:winged helix-turn-helix domain-containing protein [Chloroflexota bacterium]